MIGEFKCPACGIGMTCVDNHAEVWQRRALAAEARLAELELGRLAFDAYEQARPKTPKYAHLEKRYTWDACSHGCRQAWVAAAVAIADQVRK